LGESVRPALRVF